MKRDPRINFTQARRTAVLAGLVSLTMLMSCDSGKKSGAGNDTDTSSDTGSDSQSDTDDCIENAAGTLPEGITVIAHEDNGGTVSILDGTLGSLTLDDGSHTFGEEPLWEMVRFELSSPATIHGVRVQLGNLPGDEAQPIQMGLYDDFASNGFDFHQWEPLREGTRCLSEADNGVWADYVFETPVEVSDMGLVFAGHLWSGPEDPAILYDESQLTCDGWTYWDTCTSAINMPEAMSSNYNGYSSFFRHHYAVRLLVEYHDDIAPDDKWFQPDTSVSVGSRVAWGDYDNDGDDDLMTDGPVLFRNDDGTFTDATTQAGLESTIAPSGGGVFGDYDNDGCLDYAGQGVGIDTPDILLKNNCDGTFTDVTLASGITDEQSYQDCSSSVDPEYSPTDALAWIDLDGDGLLDLYMAEYECWQYDWTNRYVDRVWHNEGDGTFTEWTEGHGFDSTAKEVGRGLAPLDHDMDGDVDLFVSNYRLNPNFFYENNGDDSFTDTAEDINLVGVLVEGYYGQSQGPAWLDVENDGDWDLLIPHLAHPRYYDFSDTTRLMINDGTGSFEDAASASGIIYRETHYNGTVGDFDNDGYTDLFMSCYYDGRFSDFYKNNGDGTFSTANYESGLVVKNSFGAAASDYDSDGDLDMVIQHLWRNDSGTTGANWLQVRALGGTGSTGSVNAAGIGSVVTVTVDETVLMGHTNGGTGAGNQDSSFLLFGLGDSDQVDQIEVLYPGGSTVTASGPIDAGQRVWIEADGTVTYGWDYPL